MIHLAVIVGADEIAGGDRLLPVAAELRSPEGVGVFHAQVHADLTRRREIVRRRRLVRSDSAQPTTRSARSLSLTARLNVIVARVRSLSSDTDCCENWSVEPRPRRIERRRGETADGRRAAIDGRHVLEQGFLARANGERPSIGRPPGGAASASTIPEPEAAMSQTVTRPSSANARETAAAPVMPAA